MVFVPFISKRAPAWKALARRQTEDPNRTNPVVGEITIAGEVMKVSQDSLGTMTTMTLPDGDTFAGRTVGGGTRYVIYGTRSYGSGYPGRWNGRGTEGRDFPFFFWPIAWGTEGIPAYIYHSDYGTPGDESRTGGQQEYVTLKGRSNTLHILSDALTTRSLLLSVQDACRALLGPEGLETKSFFGEITPAVGRYEGPVPEAVIQYYRASSVALVLDNWNDNGTNWQSPDEGAELKPFVPLHYPDHELIDCLNRTIGERVPLVVPNGGLSGEFSSAVPLQVNAGAFLVVALGWIASAMLS